MLEKVKEKYGYFRMVLASSTYLRTVKLVAILLIVAAVPLTVLVAQQRQDLYQRASEIVTPPSPPYPSPISYPFTRAMRLDGISGYVLTPKNLMMSNDMFTVEAWIKPDAALAASSTFNSFVVSRTSISKSLDWVLGVHKYSGSGVLNKLELRFAMFTPGPTTRNWFIPNAIKPNEWQHVAVAAYNGVIKIFIDGRNVLTDNYTRFSPGAVLGPSGLVIGGTDFITGQIDTDSLYKGEIDELRVTPGNIYGRDFKISLSPYSTNREIKYLFHFNEQQGALVVANIANPQEVNTIYGNVQFVDSTIGTKTTPVPTSTPIQMPISKRVFVTSTTYNGNLGGLSGADAKCQTRANTTNLGGTWKAWLSSVTISASSRLQHNSGQYVLLNGTIIANDWNELTTLTSGIIKSPINLNELNSQILSSDVWTNTHNDGYQGQYNDCNNWLDNSSSAYGGTGRSDQTFSWTAYAARNCSTIARLYCFEQ